MGRNEMPSTPEGLDKKIGAALNAEFRRQMDENTAKDEFHHFGFSEGESEMLAVLKQAGVETEGLRVEFKAGSTPYADAGNPNSGEVYENLTIKVFQGDQLVYEGTFEDQDSSVGY